jgi:cell division protein ZapE
MASSITARYAASVAEGKVERDAAQLALVDALAQLEARIVEHRLARKSSSLGWLFAAGRSKEPPIKGIYIHGDVGRGKTMLMDFFFEASPVARKRRVHFHEFIDRRARARSCLPAENEARRARRRGRDPACRDRPGARGLAPLLR